MTEMRVRIGKRSLTNSFKISVGYTSYTSITKKRELKHIGEASEMGFDSNLQLFFFTEDWFSRIGAVRGMEAGVGSDLSPTSPFPG